jgi:hypothetical protein
MAKIDSTDPTIFLNPSASSGVRDEKKLKSSNVRKGQKTEFSGLFDNLLGRTADEIGPLMNLPVSDESVNQLMDNVRDAGDKLLSRPLPEEIIRYKQAVRNFINYIVKNNFSMGRDEGIPNYLKPNFKGQRGTPEAMRNYGYTKIEVIDKKLEDMAAMLLTNQGRQLDLISSLEEIKGLLIDLLQ